MNRSPINKRCHALVTPSEKALLQKHASAYPLAYTAYLRMRVFGQLPIPDEWERSDEHRSEDITITMSAREVDFIEEKASQKGLSISTYLHGKLFPRVENQRSRVAEKKRGTGSDGAA